MEFLMFLKGLLDIAVPVMQVVSQASAPKASPLPAIPGMESAGALNALLAEQLNESACQVQALNASMCHQALASMQEMQMLNQMMLPQLWW
jgi:hypothetical protein